MATTDTLMTQTLPTLVGLHVVSKTTDTMFGKTGKDRKGRKGSVARINTWKVHTGKLGGQYVIKKGRRVYI